MAYYRVWMELVQAWMELVLVWLESMAFLESFKAQAMELVQVFIVGTDRSRDLSEDVRSPMCMGLSLLAHQKLYAFPHTSSPLAPSTKSSSLHQQSWF